MVRLQDREDEDAPTERVQRRDQGGHAPYAVLLRRAEQLGRGLRRSACTVLALGVRIAQMRLAKCE